MTLRTFLYRALSISNDARAAYRGPVPYGRRIVRKTAYKATTRALRRFGL